MLRITPHHDDDDDRVLLKLEGRLSGVWVSELEAAWREAQAWRTAAAIAVDLCEVDVVDAAGRQLLARMHEAGSALVARGCAMSELLREIRDGEGVKR